MRAVVFHSSVAVSDIGFAAGTATFAAIFVNAALTAVVTAWKSLSSFVL